MTQWKIVLAKIKYRRLDEGPSDEAINGFYEGMRQFWHPVLQAEELTEGKLVQVQLLGERLVLAQLNGQVAVLGNYCRHFQASLSLGEIVSLNGKECIQCPYHAWTYDSSGKCVRIPQLPKGRRIPPDAKVPAYQARIKYGLVWVCIAETPTFGIPDFPEYDDDNFGKTTLYEKEALNSSSIRIIMATLDDTHFPWVHEGILGDREHPEPPDHKVYRDGDYLISTYNIEQPANLVNADMSTRDQANTQRCKITYTNFVGMPNVIRLVKDGEGGRYVIWLATCSHSYNKTSNFWVFARNYDLEPERDSIYKEFGIKVRAQDKPIVESQRPWIIPPFFTRLELPTSPGDIPLVEYHKWLEELNIVTAI